jgi:23S rRNA pseudouridine1911/1915/1917 synthase
VERPHRVVQVNARGAGRRADAYLAVRFSDWSRTAFVRFIKEGLVVSDARGAVKPSTTLAEGEVLRIYVPGLAPDAPPPPLPPVLYEDAHLLAFDKPAGLLMHSVGQRWSYGLVGLARGARPDAEVDISHRLDRETSGVVVLTKDNTVNRSMKELFQDRMVGKTYIALVRGVPAWEETVCDVPLGIALASEVELRRGPNPAGDTARTTFTVLRRLDRIALVACRPFTGRTHQIRAHLEVLGFPILGDKLYGQPDAVFLEHLRAGATADVKAAIGFPRHALHARAITFPHPVSGQAIRVKAPIPPDMRAVLEGDAPRWE